MPRLALLALLALAAPHAVAKADILLEAHDDHAGDALGGGGHFRLAGRGEVNPALELQAGRSHVILLQNLGGVPHDLVLTGALDARIPCCVAPGRSEAVQVDVPADAEGEARYVCSLHADVMQGTVRIAAAPGNAPEAVRTQDVPLGGVLLAGLALGLAALARRRA